jgi:hypothetical protein
MINQRFKNFQQSQALQRFFEAARCHCQPCTHYCSLSLSMAQRLYNVVKSFTCMCSISSTLVCRGCPLRSGLVLLTCCPGPLLYVFMPNLFILKPPPAACDNARKVDDKAHPHCEWMCHDKAHLHCVHSNIVDIHLCKSKWGWQLTIAVWGPGTGGPVAQRLSCLASRAVWLER